MGLWPLDRGQPRATPWAQPWQRLGQTHLERMLWPRRQSDSTPGWKVRPMPCCPLSGCTRMNFGVGGLEGCGHGASPVWWESQDLMKVVYVFKHKLFSSLQKSGWCLGDSKCMCMVSSLTPFPGVIEARAPVLPTSISWA